MAELYGLSQRLSALTGFHRLRCLKILRELGSCDHEPLIQHLEGCPNDTDFGDDRVWAGIMSSFRAKRRRRLTEIRAGVFRRNR